jgi:PPOX class probable F420-dependent enzyme
VATVLVQPTGATAIYRGFVTEPRAARPHMPGYGIVAADEGAGLLPWAWAESRLTASHDYWIATVWPDGRPHVTPVWGCWIEDALWFSCAPGSRKARNLEREPRMVATSDAAREPVVVDGTATRIDGDRDAVARFVAATNSKYGTDYGIDFFAANALFRLDPSSVFALDDNDFTGTPTRWTFR